ncbi:MAG TPA: alanine racemase [Bacteroidota bacterium]|nr:alanine racemase [Bacteroidota bacterium]
MSPFPPHPTHARVDVEAFRNNYRVVRSLVGRDVKIMPVVKANAYGHGVIPISRVAIEEGAAMLGVARSTEAVALRSAGIQHRILIFEITPPEHEERCLSEDCDLTVVSEHTARRAEEAARKLGRVARVHVKIDTGMTRLGIPWESALEVVKSIARMQHVVIEGVFSHFATSEAPDATFAREQLRRFESVLAPLRSAGINPPLIHMANSGAIVNLPEAHFSIVRPGLMLYGFTPRHGMRGEDRLKPVLSLHSIVTQVKVVPPGTSISYGRLYTTTRQTQIATIPIGYADGYSRLLSNRGTVLINDRRYPIAGSVCMDHIMVDVGMEGHVREGDHVTLLGKDRKEEISGWDIADLMQTIPYEVTCLIGARVPRVITEPE